MASSNVMAIVTVLLVMLAMRVKGDDNITPALSPYIDKLCDAVECGKGSCKEAVGEPFNFKCECDSGWKRTRFDNETNFEYLPCVIPNCSLDYSCMPAPPPSPSVPYNSSVFDPCYWIYCGEGTCTKNKTYTHTCQCNSGHYNLLNISAFPCYSDCALGSDCEKLGIKVSNSSSSTPSNDDNQAATSFLPGKLHWIAISLVSIAMLMWK